MLKKQTEYIITGIGLGLVIGFSVALTLGAIADSPPNAQVASPVPASVSDQTTQNDRRTPVTDAVEQVAPSVVSITTKQPSQHLFDHLYGSPSESNEGSGVVIDSDGVILTNAHVVSSATQINITFADGWSGEAEVIGIAEALDLAVLKIPNRSNLRAVSLGKSSDLILGEPVIAIGNPFGLGHTVTTGVVSATSRPLETGTRILQDFIQTDASINPGNSGGPLLNSAGELIGINTAIRPGAQGIGFAIPIDRAYKVAQDLMETGIVRLPWLSVLLRDVVFQSGTSRTTVPEVTAVIESPGTDKPGLQSGDIIVGVQGRYVQGRADLNAFLAAFQPGDILRLTVIRKQQQIDLEQPTQSMPKGAGDMHIEKVVGLRLGDAKTRNSKGAIIEAVGRSGTAAAIGIRPGDIIVGIDGQRVNSATDAHLSIERAMERHRPSALITVRRGQIQGRISLPL